MPRGAPNTGARVLQWLELQPFARKARRPAVLEQEFAVCRNEVCHRAAEPDMAMKPQPTIHGVDHPVAPARELAVLGSCAPHRRAPLTDRRRRPPR